MSKSKKILIARLGAIGDVVHTTVIQQCIKDKYPDAQIHFLTADFIAPLLQNDPNLDKVYSFDTKNKNDLFYLLSLGLKLQKERYDYIINLQNATRNIILYLIAMPKHIVKRTNVRVHAFDAFLNTAKQIFPDLDRPENLNLYLPEETKQAVQNKIQNFPRPYFVLNPGGQNDNQRQGRIWPLNNWTKLINLLTQKYDGTVFVTGSKQESEYHKELSEIASTVLYTGELSLIESAALFSCADLFVSGDSGPLHMAAALDVNTIGLMGSTAAIASGPYGPKCHSIVSKLDCVPCGQKICSKLQDGQDGMYTPCMKQISTQEVIEFIEKNISL